MPPHKLASSHCHDYMSCKHGTQKAGGAEREKCGRRASEPPHVRCASCQHGFSAVQPFSHHDRSDIAGHSRRHRFTPTGRTSCSSSAILGVGESNKMMASISPISLSWLFFVRFIVLSSFSCCCSAFSPAGVLLNIHHEGIRTSPGSSGRSRRWVCTESRRCNFQIVYDFSPGSKRHVAATSTSLQLSSSAASSFSNTNSISSVQYIASRRCLFAPSRSKSAGWSKPPLIIIGGTAQSIYSWEHHLAALSKDRDVLVYECLGQGPLPEYMLADGTKTVSVEDYFDNVTLARHADDFASFFEEAYQTTFTSTASTTNEQCVDVAGFSLGGRIALAAASVYPQLIRRLHITGVAADRDQYGKVVLASWKDILKPADCSSDDEHDEIRQQQQLRAFGWSTILATYSNTFVASMGSERIQSWVDGIVSQNTVQGISALLKQTHASSSDKEKGGINAWSPASMAERIAAQQEALPDDERIVGRLCVGSEDEMATVVEVERLANILKWGRDYSFRCFDGAGHAVPMECGREWRSDLLGFLSD